MKRLLDIITFPIRYEIKKGVEHIVSRIETAPECCGESMEYLGEHTGMYTNTQFYQCQKCKRLELMHKHDWEKK